MQFSINTAHQKFWLKLTEDGVAKARDYYRRKHPQQPAAAARAMELAQDHQGYFQFTWSELLEIFGGTQQKTPFFDGRVWFTRPY